MTRPTPAPREQRGDCYWGKFSDGNPCTLPGRDHSIPQGSLKSGDTIRVTAAGQIPSTHAATLREPLIDPDCRDGKCGSCAGGPCEHYCHGAFEVVGSLPGLDLVSLDGRHVHYWRQAAAGLVCACGETVTA